MQTNDVQDSQLRKLVYNNQADLFDFKIATINNQQVITAQPKTNFLGFQNVISKAFTDVSNVSVAELSPKMASQLLQDTESINSSLKFQLSTHVTKQASDTPENIAHGLKSLVERMGLDADAPLAKLVSASDDPKKLYQQLSELGYFEEGDVASQLQGSPTLNRAIQGAKEDPEGLMSVSESFEGPIDTVKQNIKGINSPSLLYSRLQNA